MGKALKVILKTLAVTVGVIVALVVLLVVGINSKPVHRYLDRFLAEHIDAEVQYSRLHIALLKSLPDIDLSIEDLSLTYPHERFSAYDGKGMQSAFLESGRGEAADTLASLGRLTASVNPWKLRHSRIQVEQLRIEGLRAFAHQYDDTVANWNIFHFGGGDDSEDSPSTLPEIYVGEFVADAPEAVFTSLPSSVAARMSLDELRLSGVGEYDLLLRSGLLAQLPGFGTLDVPVQLDGRVGFRQDGEDYNFDLPRVDARIAHIPMHIEGTASVCKDGVPVNLRLEVDDCSVDSLLVSYGYSLFPAARDFGTDALLSLTASADGVFSDSSRPLVDASASIPSAKVSYFPYGATGELFLNATASDLLGRDPAYDAHGKLDAVLDGVSLPEELAMRARGSIYALLDARAKQSQLTGKELQKATIRLELGGDEVGVAMLKDTLRTRIFAPKIVANSDVDGFDLTIDLDSLSLRKGRGLLARVRGMSNHGRVTKVQVGDNRVPQIVLSSNASAFVQSGANRLGIRNMDLDVNARRNVRRQDGRAKAFLDSLQFVYPGVARQDLLAEMRKHSGRPVPSFLQEKDFEKGDISINLDSSIVRYLRQWNPQLRLSFRQGFVATPSLPLRTRIDGFAGSFDGDALNIDTLAVTSGTSDIAASGKVTGLRRALSGKGIIRAQAGLSSSRVNINELVAALDMGKTIKKDTSTTIREDDESFVTDKLANANIDDKQMPLIIVPANLIGELSLDVDRVDFKDIEVRPLSAKARIQERTLQLVDARADTPLGSAVLDAYYSTRTKQSISAGVDMDLSNISAQGIIGLLPQMDSLLPALKSFEGKLGCNISATTQLDTNMNVLIPTLDGVININGRDLNISDAGDLRKVTKLLMFRNKDIGHIDDLDMSAVIHDGKIEVFPFELGVDRYRVALQGMQGLDKTMYYHVSVLRSPFLIRFGVDIYGTSDNWRFGLTRAKYKIGNVPAFTQELDAMKLNIAGSIQNIFTRGVESVKMYNEMSREAIERKKRSINYTIESSPLSGEEFAEVDSLSISQELAEMDQALEDEVQAVLNESFAETETLLQRYVEEAYTKRVLKKIDKLRKKS